MTTRHPRRGEKNRKDYRYISEKSFKRGIKKGNFLEWERNFGYLYGTPKRFVLEKIKQGKSLLLSIDVKGTMVVKRKFPESVLIFVKPPSVKELSHRLKARKTDRKIEIAKRLAMAKNELAYALKYDHIVLNNRLKNAVDDVVAIIKKERGK